MIYHVLPGDSLVAEFKKTNIAGEVIVCRECLIVGPVDAETPFEFWDERARFVLTEYGEDEIEFHERVADELEKLIDIGPDDEVNLWFEYELFCSVNMWFCLSLLKDSGAAIYRVEPISLHELRLWDGFGGLTAKELQACFEMRTLFTIEEIGVGIALWNTFRRKKFDALACLATVEHPCFPHLRQVCKAAIEKDTRPKQILNEIMGEGITDFSEIFPEFTRRAGVYGYGDLQVERLMREN